MKSLDTLRPIADEMLGGLQADMRLLAAIRARARSKPAARLRVTRVLAAACALVVCAVGLWVVTGGMPGTQESALPRYKTMAAGDIDGIKEGFRAYDLQPGSITLSTNNTSPSYRSIWTPSSGGNFPMICVEGRYYRMLTNPTSLSSSQLGSALGTVTVYTNEPSTAGTQGIVSNAAAEGETVYAVSGMSGAMVAANINGVTRVFQRVSYGGSALRGGESLSDTLRASDVRGLELTGVGTITDSAVASRLMSTLLDNAFYQGSGCDTGSGSLLIQLSNGLTLQMGVSGDTLYACGAWACPEFFEAYRAAAGQQ